MASVYSNLPSLQGEMYEDVMYNLALEYHNILEIVETLNRRFDNLNRHVPELAIDEPAHVSRTAGLIQRLDSAVDALRGDFYHGNPFDVSEQVLDTHDVIDAAEDSLADLEEAAEGYQVDRIRRALDIRGDALLRDLRSLVTGHESLRARFEALELTVRYSPCFAKGTGYITYMELHVPEDFTTPFEAQAQTLDEILETASNVVEEEDFGLAKHALEAGEKATEQLEAYSRHLIRAVGAFEAAADRVEKVIKRPPAQSCPPKPTYPGKRRYMPPTPPSSNYDYKREEPALLSRMFASASREKKIQAQRHQERLGPLQAKYVVVNSSPVDQAGPMLLTAMFAAAARETQTPPPTPLHHPRPSSFYAQQALQRWSETMSELMRIQQR